MASASNSKLARNMTLSCKCTLQIINGLKGNILVNIQDLNDAMSIPHCRCLGIKVFNAVCFLSGWYVDQIEKSNSTDIEYSFSLFSVKIIEF